MAKVSIRRCDVGDGAIGGAVFAPGHDVVAGDLPWCGGDRSTARNRGEADEMLANAIDQVATGARGRSHRRGRPPGETLIGEVDHARCIGDTTVEPGLDGMAIGRSDIEGLRRHQRAHMAGDDHVRGGVGRGGGATQTRSRRSPGIPRARPRPRARRHDGCDEIRASSRRRPTAVLDPAREVCRRRLERQSTRMARRSASRGRAGPPARGSPATAAPFQRHGQESSSPST